MPEGHGTLVVPEGFHFLDKEQSRYVLSDLWENPEDPSILGMLFPVNMRVLDPKTWGFTISFDKMDYVNDDEAESINYKELLSSSKDDVHEQNPERKKRAM